jgi:hypothetical protein
MKGLGVGDVISGIKNSSASNELVLFQSYYIEKIIDKFLKTIIALSKYKLT